MTKPPTKKMARPAAPRDIAAALLELDALRPGNVPPGATVLCSWVKLPGDNAGRADWRRQQAWKQPLINHFSACMEAQPHPGVLRHPQVHVLMLVPRVGDEINRFSRAKFAIDRLQIRRVVPYVKESDEAGNPVKMGERVYGLLDLIQDDSVLTSRNCTIIEERAKQTRTVNDCKIVIWVWEGADDEELIF